MVLIDLNLELHRTSGFGRLRLYTLLEFMPDERPLWIQDRTDTRFNRL